MPCVFEFVLHECPCLGEVPFLLLPRFLLVLVVASELLSLFLEPVSKVSTVDFECFGEG